MPQATIRIAHVEDQILDHYMLMRTLGDRYKVTYFKALNDFIEYKESFDLIITDLSLPESFGAETLLIIKNHVQTTPILALTGLGGPFITGDIMKTLMSAGADNVVSKDIIRDDRIIAIIKDLLPL